MWAQLSEKVDEETDQALDRSAVHLYAGLGLGRLEADDQTRTAASIGGRVSRFVPALPVAIGIGGGLDVWNETTFATRAHFFDEQAQVCRSFSSGGIVDDRFCDDDSSTTVYSGFFAPELMVPLPLDVPGELLVVAGMRFHSEAPAVPRAGLRYASESFELSLTAGTGFVQIGGFVYLSIE